MQLTNKCKCGTDAIAEISDIVRADYYVNLQGDEPLILPNTIEQFVDGILQGHEYIAFNAMATCDIHKIGNKNIPKVVTNNYDELIYMSRYPIPYKKTNHQPTYYKELGMHAYTKRGLDYFYGHYQGDLEKVEGLEFLRFLEHGMKVKMINLQLPFDNHAIDVTEDVKIVEGIMKHEGIE
jgi:3-deoxy-manno-octulosonate cytidylyltransferase (CMP-KDO synthetase)